MKQKMDSHQWDSSHDAAIVPLFLSLQWAQSQSLSRMRPVLTKHRLGSAEFDVLATLRNAPEPHQLTPSRIQEGVVITSGGLTKVMLQLEERGLVTRLRQAGDQRVKPVLLTASGKAAVEAAMAEVVRESAAWVRGLLVEEEIAELIRLLGRLADGANGSGSRGQVSPTGKRLGGRNSGSLPA